MDDMAAAAVANELAGGESDPDVKEILKSQDPSSSTDAAEEVRPKSKKLSRKVMQRKKREAVQKRAAEFEALQTAEREKRAKRAAEFEALQTAEEKRHKSKRTKPSR